MMRTVNGPIFARIQRSRSSIWNRRENHYLVKGWNLEDLDMV